MEADHFPQKTLNIPLPRTSPSDLRGRQSVRATFKLPERTIDAVSIVAAHLGIKQKSLFDHLIEDVQSLCSIADEIRQKPFPQRTRVQKTYVISRRSLSSLEQISRDYDTPRDALIEYSVQRLLPIIRKEREKHRKRKEILDELAKLNAAGEQILMNSKTSLGEEDPVHAHLEAAMGVFQNALRKIDLFIERGKRIEDF